MTLRQPLVLVAGAISELPVGDTVGGAAGGAAAISSVTLDFGATPVPAMTFTFADGAVTSASKIVMTCAGPAAGRPLDELEMDSLTCVASCLVNGQVTAIVTAAPGPVSGQYKFNYLVG